ncbi:cysteine methyltransferase [Sphingomonas sp. S-NIH.Pt3_0716]|nr:cysteine methyltransferase [Sphingomonas sp. S-NIH.Pt3_0716]
MTLACMMMPSPVGDLTLVASDEGLMAVLWHDDDPARVRLGARSEATDHPVLRDATSQLSEYFAGQRQHFSVPLHFQGTDFQRQVWAALLDIPFGETRSYADIARAIGRPTATRAVGAANGRNPISIIAPCHRVVGSNGALTGFAGGVETKKYLLDLEQGGDNLFSFAPMPLADAGARSV